MLLSFSDADVKPMLALFREFFRLRKQFFRLRPGDSPVAGRHCRRATTLPSLVRVRGEAALTDL